MTRGALFVTDWRLNGQEEYLTNKTFYKIIFPEFWKTSYDNQNIFYQKILSYAKKCAETTNHEQEFLKDENIQHFWHEHCEFCWEKALTDQKCTFYCTEDMRYWICEKCFHDFAEKFNWTVKPAEDLF